jgi:ABC-type multidrug transport system ATPase subunit
MSDPVLNALVHLFALIASSTRGKLSKASKNIVKQYLERFLNEDLVKDYYKIFENYYQFYYNEIHDTWQSPKIDPKKLIIHQANNVCRKIKLGLNRKDRIFVFLELLEFVNEDEIVTDQETEIIEVVSDSFKIGDAELTDIQEFVLTGSLERINRENILVADNQLKEWEGSISWFMNKKKEQDSVKHLYKENLYGKLLFLYIPSIEEFILRFEGEQNLYLGGHRIKPGRIYFIEAGSIIRGPNISPVYYTDIANKFFIQGKFNEIVFSGKEVEYKFPNSNNGIHPFSFCEESGNMVGIMGGSGVGKSTLLNLINGKVRVDSGQITINGFDTYKSRFRLQGIIGFVPQDDLLMEELSVYQNLYYNAKLCFANYSEDQINHSVEKILLDLDLNEIAGLQVGNPLNKTISGGQRKRLNIGLELLREPYILILDEPTSGLSSTDSKMVVELLKSQTRMGKLVIATIHQPSSEIFRMFDKLWVLDKGGYPVYTGNPVDAIVYFKTINAQVNAAESECPKCGNIETDQILKIIEAKTIDDNGIPTSERKTKPQKWYAFYKEKIEAFLKVQKPSKILPEINFKVPSANKQFITFSVRNLLAKIANKQYMAINLLEAPLLAFILSYFTKYVRTNVYTFQDNKNFPVFIFMSVVVALFMGLTVSAEEIVKDRKILERESFLNLSWPAYLSSKIIYLFGLSAIQSFAFVFISFQVLDIRGMFFTYWLVLFSTSALGNMIGLNISSGLDSVVAIYILIPLILVPQLLLGGAMISFDDLNKGLTNKKYVPMIGDLMITRWAYEALTVEQFKSNKFEKHFFDDEQIISTVNYTNSFLLPDLNLKLKTCLHMVRNDNIDKEVFRHNIRVIRNEIKKMIQYQQAIPFDNLSKLHPDSLDPEILEETAGYLSFIKQFYIESETNAMHHKDYVYDSLAQQIGDENMIHFRQNYYNNKLADMVTNKTEIRKIYESEDELIRKLDPIFIMPDNKLGRAQFYAPYKMLNHQIVNTLWFNMVIVWLGAVFLYFTLVFDVLRKILTYFRNLRLARKSLKKG